jgi:hypothetical protein
MKRASSRATASKLSNSLAADRHDDSVAGREENLSDFYRLPSLAEKGNHFAMELAFQIRPLYQNAAAPSEDLDNSVGLAAAPEPTFFLRCIRKYNVSAQEFETMVVQTWPESIDHLRAQREELERRIESFSKLTDPGLFPLRQQAVSFIKQQIRQYLAPPGGAGGM